MKSLLTILIVLIFLVRANAQHNHGHLPVKKTETTSPVVKKDTVPPNQNMHAHSKQQTMKPAAKKDTVPHNHNMPGHEMDMNGDDHETMSMSGSFSRNLPMNRNGSGTSWLPDNSPVYAYMFHKNNWMYMLHANMFVRYNKQDIFDKGSRGDSKFDAPGMFMFMGQRKTGRHGLFHFNIMASPDPFTVGKAGYPLLFQTGETNNGRPLVDRQHPHDLVAELSASYAYELSPRSDIFIYAGYPGEPALGPSAFVHRPSGLANPDAPLTHHWVDATHITFGVVTLGYRYNKWKIEASSFTGREPDEERYGFDRPRFDSWSGRLSFNPSSQWALQASHGFIKEPEVLHPGEDVRRTTASATYSLKSNKERFTNITALWGMNKTPHHNAEHGLLLEGAFTNKRTTVYGRYEWVQKSAEELAIEDAGWGSAAIFPVHAFTAGASYDIFNTGRTKIALGGQLSVSDPDNRLNNLYGSRPVSGQVYLRFYPKAMGN